MEICIDIATQEERKMFFGKNLDSEDIRWFHDICQKDPDYNLKMLYLLYRSRGDKQTAERYFKQIKDPKHRISASLLANEGV